MTNRAKVEVSASVLAARAEQTNSRADNQTNFTGNANLWIGASGEFRNLASGVGIASLGQATDQRDLDASFKSRQKFHKGFRRLSRLDLANQLKSGNLRRTRLAGDGVAHQSNPATARDAA